MNPKFWSGKRVFLTGHTGFKGSWLSLWLHQLGATVVGYSLGITTAPSLYELVGVSNNLQNLEGDIRDLATLQQAMETAQPEIVVHMAAQSLVRRSYEAPVETFATNVMGTVHVLEAARKINSVRVVLNITSDKCYENQERREGYRETEAMGGYDPYSSSKGCAELVTSAYRRSYFQVHNVLQLASARAGNVIGGGDWAEDRLIPDMMRAFMAGCQVSIRNPQAIRPWQHVLEPLGGYLLLMERLWEDGAAYADGWNFGPAEVDIRPVGWLVEQMAHRWGASAKWTLETELQQQSQPHEANLLSLDCTKARKRLNWQPALTLDEALDWIVEWYQLYHHGGDVATLCLDQIHRYQERITLCDSTISSSKAQPEDISVELMRP